MIFDGNQSIFDQVFPFSFECDREGRVTTIGRSLKRLCPHIQVGDLCRTLFGIAQPMGFTLDQPATLGGELVVLECLHQRERKYRGHVVELGEDSASLLFVLRPVITSLCDISRLNLKLTDFELSEPIFDFLLFMQGQQTNQAKLRETQTILQWENRVSKLLLDIALATEGCESEREIYRTALADVCATLNWEFGHVFVAADHDQEAFVSGGVCVNRAPERLKHFEEASRNLTLSAGEGLAGAVANQCDVVWVNDIQHQAFFVRKDVARNLPSLTGVGVPIYVNNTVIAVLEFFSEHTISNSGNMRRFFERLSLQLGGSIARYRAERTAREHLAGLANAAKMATLGELAAGVAHEINNPLHTLTLTSHLLRRLVESGRLSTEALRDQLGKIDKSAQRMSTIIGALKAFSRDSSVDPLQTTSLRKLIQDTLSLSDATLSGHDVTITVSNIPEAWSVECRPSQISQVILNLLNNAFDAVHQQENRWIRLEVFDEGEFFQIAVSDSGPGIPESVAHKIMTPFFTTKPPGKGTGLGLSISSTIMSDHGGGLSLDRSAPFTRFVATLPKHRATETLETHTSDGSSCDTSHESPAFGHHIHRTRDADWSI